MHITVIDYGMGNLRSVSKALEHVAPGARVSVTSGAAEILSADRVVFPGQGAAPDCMREIDARGLRPVILEAAKTRPFLGICMGLQVLFSHSAEGNTPCLGLFRGEVRRFPDATMRDAHGLRLKVPHMGWNQVRHTRPHPLWQGISDQERFYFVHSYYVIPEDPALVAGTCDYGAPFTCAAGSGNIFAVQFHPEKSQHAGLALLGNFTAWDGRDTAA